MRDWLEREDLFASYVSGESWASWKTLLIGFCGEPLTVAEIAKYKELVGHDYVEVVEPDEIFLCAPRRVGKTSAASIFITHQILTKDYSSLVRPGEHPQAVLVAQGISEAKELLSYIKGYFDKVELLHGLIEGETATSLRIANDVHVHVHAGQFRAIRSHSIVIAGCDEEAFWMDRGANPAAQVLSAIYPSLQNMNGKIIHLSSPYAKVGPLYEASLKYADGHDPKTLWVHVKDVAALNPNITQERLNRERARDPLNFAREWQAEFEEGYQQFIDIDLVRSLCVPGRRELPPREGIEYRCFVDPAGGGSDEYCCCIAHIEYLGGECDIEHQIIVIDVLRGRRGRSDDITVEYAKLMKQYGIHECTGDRFAADWPRNAMEREGITFIVSEKNKSDLYAEALPILHQKRCVLLDDKFMVQQFAELQNVTSTQGRNLIRHPTTPGSTDDRANVCSGAIVLWSGEEINYGAMYLKSLGTPEGVARNNQQMLEQQLRRVQYGSQIHY